MRTVGFVTWSGTSLRRSFPVLRAEENHGTSDQALRDHFGPEKLDASATSGRSCAIGSSEARAAAGNIIFIPGIMGSELSVTEDDDDDMVWVSFLKLIWGGIKKLRLANDGVQEADSKLRVQPSGLDKDSYAETILWLKAYWNVEPFAYDWRKDLDRAAERLKVPCGNQVQGPTGSSGRPFHGRPGVSEFYSTVSQGVEGHVGAEESPGRPTHYARHAELRFLCHCASDGRQGQTREVVGGGRSAPRLGEVLDVLNGFVGSYQLLPSPAKLPPSEQGLYDRGAWGRYPIVPAHLQRAERSFIQISIGSHH